MKREFIRTEDGSVSLYLAEWNEHYHSIHGAIQEAVHIFIRAGIEYSTKSTLSILEAGFGTGLNAWLSLIWASDHQTPINYHTLEKYPLLPEEVEKLNYSELTPFQYPELFQQLHTSLWNTPTQLTPFFRFTKHLVDFREISFTSQFDIVFFDAFNPNVQPHLWTKEVFAKFYQALKPEGILVTYCVKGSVKQALRQVGFEVKKLPGPPGKREMLRALRT